MLIGERRVGDNPPYPGGRLGQHAVLPLPVEGRSGKRLGAAERQIADGSESRPTLEAD